MSHCNYYLQKQIGGERDVAQTGFFRDENPASDKRRQRGKQGGDSS